MTPLLVAIPLVFAAPVPKELKKPPSIVGEWRMIWHDTGSGQTKSENAVWVFTTERVRFVAPSSDGESWGALTFDLTATPNQFVLDLRKNGKNAAIFEVDGDTMRLCLQTGNATPPTAFKPGGGCYLYKFERVKPK
jgi:uncharacterized protein (TIGR03067 family)